MSEPPAVDVLIAHDSGDLRSVEFLAAALDRTGLRTSLMNERDFTAQSGDPVEVLRSVRALVLAVADTAVPDFLFKLARAARAASDGIDRRRFVVLLRDVDEGVVEQLYGKPQDALDLRSGVNEELVGRLIKRIQASPDLPPPATTQAPPPPNIPDLEQISKRSPRRSQPASPPPSPTSPPDVGEIWNALDTGVRDVLAQADAVARSRGASAIHSEDLLIGLYREPDGPTGHILQAAHVSDQAVAQIVTEQIPTISPAARLPIDASLESPPSLSRHSTEALRWAYSSARTSNPAASLTTQHVLGGLVSLTDCSVAERLREAGITVESVLGWRRPEPEPGPLPTPEALAGFRSDSTSGKDLLNIGPEVDAIATVLAARTVQPPLALGLFGDWGTGKSFFMDRLERRIDQFSKAEAAADRHGKERVYCRHIVQLKFNAWHYIDENLWASLANAIFEGLDDALTNRNVEDVTEQTTRRTDLILKRAQAQERLDDARKRQADADRVAAAAKAKVDGVDGLYDELVDAVQPGAVLTSSLMAALAQPDVSDSITAQRDKIDRQLVATAQQLAIDPDTLRKALAGRSPFGILAAWRALFMEKGRRLWLAIAGIALLVVALTAAFSALGVDAAALLGAAVGIGFGVLGPLRPLVVAAQKVSRVVIAARAEGKRLVEQQREEIRKAALEEKAKADEKAVKAALDVQAEEKKFDVVAHELTKLRPGREMAEFVRVRQASNVYKSRLGVVARARDDFEELTRLLVREWPDPDPEKEAEDGPKPIERIILYIDDLDRVKEKEVVAVLQAVHLLLAFRLFVVVVAVDPRWLLHSLRVESSVFNADQQGLSDDEEDGFGWESTPLNYLEKIFQIPFALRPMGSAGFGAIVDNLVDYKPATADDGANGHVTSETATGAGLQPSDTSGNGATTSDLQSVAKPLEGGQEPVGGGETPAPVTTGSPAPSHAAEDGDEEEPRPVVMKPRALEINEDERLFMARMHPLIGTPRGAKRFVNVYRLLKASHSVAEQGDFARPEVHRPVLLLLACLTGFPRETAEILRALVEDEPAGSWWKFVIDFSEEAAKGAAGKDQLRKDSWEQFVAKLRQVQSAETAGLSCDDLRARARRVARYSFESSRILFMEAEDARSSKAPPVTKPRTAKARAP